MKIFQVVRKGSEWCVLIPDASSGVHSSAEKSLMISWACDAARRVNGEVQVRDVGGRIEATYTYVDGVEVRKPPAAIVPMSAER